MWVHGMPHAGGRVRALGCVSQLACFRRCFSWAPASCTRRQMRHESRPLASVACRGCGGNTAAGPGLVLFALAGFLSGVFCLGCWSALLVGFVCVLCFSLALPTPLISGPRLKSHRRCQCCCVSGRYRPAAHCLLWVGACWLASLHEGPHASERACRPLLAL